MHSKQIILDGVYNVRDLSSIKNKEGFYIKKNKLIRGSRLFEASHNDLRKLYEDYDVRMIFDFRGSVEKYEEPDKTYKDEKYFDIIVQEESYYGVSMDSLSKKKKEYFEKLNKEMKNEDFMIKHMCEFYYSMAEEFSCLQYGKYLKLLLNNDGGAYLHCSLGRDRSGIATALILECLDVDREDIYEDYVYTNVCTKGLDIDLAYRVYLESYYQAINDRYGSVDNMFKFMGIFEKEKQLLKEKYLEK